MEMAVEPLFLFLRVGEIEPRHEDGEKKIRHILRAEQEDARAELLHGINGRDGERHVREGRERARWRRCDQQPRHGAQAQEVRDVDEHAVLPPCG